MKTKVSEIKAKLESILKELEPYPDNYMFDVEFEHHDDVLEFSRTYDINFEKTDVVHESCTITFQN